MPLKEFVADYTAKTGGKNRRVEFNKKPKKTLQQYKVAGDALKAFLSFDEPKISEEVLKEVLGKGWTETRAKDFSKWLITFSKWSWPPGQQHIYDQPLCTGGGMAPAYASPICHLKKVTASVQGGAGASKTVALEVLGEGFLPGCTIECVNASTKAVIKAGKVKFDKLSTFRCSLLKATATLPTGTYRARVVDNVGKGGTYTIDRTKDGKLPKSFKVA